MKRCIWDVDLEMNGCDLWGSRNLIGDKKGKRASFQKKGAVEKIPVADIN